MKFAVHILGSNSAVPAHGRYPSSHYLEILDHNFLIDCGEGTQVRLQENGLSYGKLSHIFISHLHGDHVFGLIGLLTSMSLNNRRESLVIYSPPGLQELIEVQLRQTGGSLVYPLRFEVVDATAHQLIFENEQLTIHTIPLKHRLPTCGYLFREKMRPRNMQREKIAEYELRIEQIKAAKAGEDILLPDGRTIPNEELTLAGRPPRAYAYCSDTRFSEAIVPIIQGVDLLYHETTFLHDRLDFAELTLHSTAKEAATIARAAEVGKLICGHYSSRYRDLAPVLAEARSVFPNSELGEEGKVFEVPY